MQEERLAESLNVFVRPTKRSQTFISSRGVSFNFVPTLHPKGSSIALSPLKLFNSISEAIELDAEISTEVNSLKASNSTSSSSNNSTSSNAPYLSPQLSKRLSILAKLQKKKQTAQ